MHIGNRVLFAGQNYQTFRYLFKRVLILFFSEAPLILLRFDPILGIFKIAVSLVRSLKCIMSKRFVHTGISERFVNTYLEVIMMYLKKKHLKQLND